MSTPEVIVQCSQPVQEPATRPWVSLRQQIVADWVTSRFGPEVLVDQVERGTRVVEEGIELAQSVGVGKETILGLVERVYSREPGDPRQEAGGLGVTLLAFCSTMGFDMEDAINHEIARIHAFPVDHWLKRQNAKAAAGLGAFCPGPGANG